MEGCSSRTPVDSTHAKIASDAVDIFCKDVNLLRAQGIYTTILKNFEDSWIKCEVLSRE